MTLFPLKLKITTTLLLVFLTVDSFADSESNYGETTTKDKMHIQKMGEQIENFIKNKGIRNGIPGGIAAYSEETDFAIRKFLSENQPTEVKQLNRTNSITVRVSIVPDGSIDDLKLIKSSGNVSYDRSTINLLKKAPIPPFPGNIKNNADILTTAIVYAPYLYKSPSAVEKSRHGITFSQGNRKISVNPSTDITYFELNNTPFLIEATAAPTSPALQICVSSSEKVFQQLLRTNQINDLPCFHPGSGIAMTEKIPKKGWPLTLAQGKAHNYFDKSRSIFKDGRQLVNISDIKTNIPSGSRSQVISMIILYDKNIDKVINHDEYWLFKIKLTP